MPPRRSEGDERFNPYGHVAFQAQRGDVHTVLVDGRVVKRDHKLVSVDLAAARSTVEATVEHLRSTLGEEAWAQGIDPDVPETAVLDNPYTCTDTRAPRRTAGDGSRSAPELSSDGL